MSKKSKVEEVKNIKTETQSVELTKSIKNNQLEKPLSWHIANEE